MFNFFHSASIPITLDDKTHDLDVYEGQAAEEAVLVFCKVHLGEDLSGCVRQLLPNVLALHFSFFSFLFKSMNQRS
jgi:hypothetical protein